MKIVQFFNSDKIPECYKFFMDKIKNDKPQNVQYKLITKFPQNFDLSKFSDIRFASSLFRLQYLRDNPDSIWMDSDIIITKWFDFNPELSYLFKGPYECVMYISHNDRELVSEIINNFSVFDKRHMSSLLAKYKHRFQIIPEGYFKHLAIGLTLNNIAGLWQQISNQDICFTRQDNNKILVKFEGHEFLSNYPKINFNFNNDDVTLVTVCMNRESFLLQSYKSWLNYGFTNIIVVDWSSDINLQEIEELNKLVKIIRVDGQKEFHGSKSRNFGAKFVTTKYVMFIDSDVKIASNLNIFEVKNCFFRGGLPNDRHTLGTFFVEVSNFKRVNGFNESMNGYGYEDEDIFHKFIDIGLYEHSFAFTSLIHIDHDDNLRIKYRNSDNENIKDSLKKNIEISNKNRKTVSV